MAMSVGAKLQSLPIDRAASLTINLYSGLLQAAQSAAKEPKLVARKCPAETGSERHVFKKTNQK